MNTDKSIELLMQTLASKKTYIHLIQTFPPIINERDDVDDVVDDVNDDSDDDDDDDKDDEHNLLCGTEPADLCVVCMFSTAIGVQNVEILWRTRGTILFDRTKIQSTHLRIM